MILRESRMKQGFLKKQKAFIFSQQALQTITNSITLCLNNPKHHLICAPYDLVSYARSSCHATSVEAAWLVKYTLSE